MEVFWGWMYVDYLSVESRAFTNVENHPDIPQIFSLEQNYPNPFNPSTTIMYSLPVSGHVKLKVYDILGKQVAALIDKEQNRGSYEIPFDASFLPSGVYFYRLSSNKFTQTRKMIILK
jgi:hypothetical protein